MKRGPSDGDDAAAAAPKVRPRYLRLDEVDTQTKSRLSTLET